MRGDEVAARFVDEYLRTRNDAYAILFSRDGEFNAPSNEDPSGAPFDASAAPVLASAPDHPHLVVDGIIA